MGMKIHQFLCSTPRLDAVVLLDLVPICCRLRQVTIELGEIPVFRSLLSWHGGPCGCAVEMQFIIFIHNV